MPRICLLATDGAGHGPALAAHLRGLQRDGAVLFVTADRSAGSWGSDWTNAGLDPARLVVIDAVGAMNGTQPVRGPANTTFLPSPAMLEMMALRIEQLIRRHAPVRVVIDSLNALALYNGVAGVQAFVHYLVNRLRGTGVGADFVLHPGQDAAALRGGLASFIDGQAALGEPKDRDAPGLETVP